MQLSPQLEASRRQAIEILNDALVLVQDQSRLSRGNREAFSGSLVTLAQMREVLAHLGDQPLRFQHVGPITGGTRPELQRQQEENTEQAAREKSAIVQIVRDAMKSSMDVITNQKEEEADVVKAVSMLDTMLSLLKNNALRNGDNAAQFDSFHKTLLVILKEDLLGPLTKRQEDLLRVTENFEEQLLNNPAYSRHLKPEQLHNLAEVRDRITRRARGFLERRTRAYGGFFAVLTKVPSTAQMRSGSAIQDAYGLLAKTKKGLEIMHEDSMETGRMFRVEHGKFKEIIDSLVV